MPPFFRLTTTFFGLTSEYKATLLEEIFICTQHMKNMSYSDVLSMPVYERRYFLTLLTKEHQKREEMLEEQKEAAKTTSTTSKGNRTTKVSGNALKSRMKAGDIPLT